MSITSSSSPTSSPVVRSESVSSEPPELTAPDSDHDTPSATVRAPEASLDRSHVLPLTERSPSAPVPRVSLYSRATPRVTVTSAAS
ncbi:MAG: hypothetical protein EXR69_15730 [Myxococcales bacterium]|nr:hypothetical protein [Myxococcales bacterium]